MTRLRSAPAQGTGLNDQAHHATVSMIHTSATRNTIGTEIYALRFTHIARISNGGSTYKRLDSADVLSAPTIAAGDQRGGLNCNARNRQAIPIAHDKKNAPTIRFVVLCMPDLVGLVSLN